MRWMPWMCSERQPLPRLGALVLAALPVSAGVVSPQALAIRPTAAIASMLSRRRYAQSIGIVATT